MVRVRTCLLICVGLSLAGVSAEETPAQRGYRHLLETAYVPAFLDQEVFDHLWQTWPQPLRDAAEHATPEQRRKMAFARYGLTLRPGDTSGKPQQFVVDAVGNWTPNCFTCHGGEVAGRYIPGLPNSQYAMQTLIQESRLTKLRLGKPLATVDYGSLAMPLGETHGTTNAVMFGVALATFRDADLNIVPPHQLAPLVHHDMEAPPWWVFSKKQRLYLEGFASKGHRPLMQFALDRSNGPDKFVEWEDDFRDICAYIESLEPPKYPFPIDAKLANQGQQLFNSVCADCHGTYGKSASYPERNIPIDKVGTDRVRYDALTSVHHEGYRQSWFSHYGADPVSVGPPGYVAPPLDGLWASAPYFHNGSVPTLWHVLHAEERPVVWKRTAAGYDQDHVGLEIELSTDVPPGIDVWTRRAYFDTRNFGKSAAGHLFPNALTETEKRALLEYLKQL